MSICSQGKPTIPVHRVHINHPHPSRVFRNVFLRPGTPSSTLTQFVKKAKVELSPSLWTQATHLTLLVKKANGVVTISSLRYSW